MIQKTIWINIFAAAESLRRACLPAGRDSAVFIRERGLASAPCFAWSHEAERFSPGKSSYCNFHGLHFNGVDNNYWHNMRVCYTYIITNGKGALMRFCPRRGLSFFGPCFWYRQQIECMAKNLLNYFLTFFPLKLKIIIFSMLPQLYKNSLYPV